LRTSTSPFFTGVLRTFRFSSFSSIFRSVSVPAAAVTPERARSYPPCWWMMFHAVALRRPASTVTRNRPAFSSFS